MSMFSEPARTLETENFILRSLTEEDATEKYLSWLNDIEVTKYLEVRLVVSSIESIRNYIRSHDNRTSFLLGIFDKKTGNHIGNYSIRCDSYHSVATVGVMIGDRDYWGRRVITESRRAVVDFLFDEAGMAKAQGACYANNLPAIFNYKAQRYRKEGTLKSHRLFEGKRVDLIMFAILPDERPWISSNDE